VGEAWEIDSVMNACAGTCQCRAAAAPASAIAALRMARSLALPPTLFTNGALFESAVPVQRLKMARWPLQLGAARIAASNGAFYPMAIPQQKRLRPRDLRVVNKLQGSNWLNGQGPSFWQLQVSYCHTD